MIAFYDAVARRRLRFLLAVLFVSAALGVMFQTTGHHPIGVAVSIVVMFLLFAVSLFVIVLQYLLSRQHRPAVLRRSADGDAFETPVTASQTLLAAGLTVLYAALIIPVRIGDMIRGEPDWPRDLWTWAPALPFVVFAWHMALRPAVVRLRPDSVQARLTFGSVAVRWEAFTAADVTVAGRATLLLPIRSVMIRRPGTGRRGDILLATGLDAERLAAVIRGYAADPTRRAAIGTEAELARLTDARADAPAVP